MIERSDITRMQILNLSDFSNKNATEKVDAFNKTILNILSNFTTHETITCDDRDPPCFNEKIKSLIYEKMQHLKSFAAIEIIVS